MVHGEDQALFPSWNLANPGVLECSMAELQDNWDWRSNPKKTPLLVTLANVKDRRVADSYGWERRHHQSSCIALSTQSSQNIATSCARHYLKDMELAPEEYRSMDSLTQLNFWTMGPEDNHPFKMIIELHGCGINLEQPCMSFGVLYKLEQCQELLA